MLVNLGMNCRWFKVVVRLNYTSLSWTKNSINFCRNKVIFFNMLHVSYCNKNVEGLIFDFFHV